MQVLEEYLKLHEFAGQDFLPALRQIIFLCQSLLLSFLFTAALCFFAGTFYLASNYPARVKRLTKSFSHLLINTSSKIPAHFTLLVSQHLYEYYEVSSCFLLLKIIVEDAYVLAYAAILLNTTLHNTNAKSQNLSLADEKTFIQTMLDFDKETNLSEEMIRVSFCCYLPLCQARLFTNFGKR